MFRRMLCVAAVLALLSVLTAGAVEARPLAAGPAPAGFLQELWQWAVSGLAPVLNKDTSQMDPNGLRYHAIDPRDADRGHHTGTPTGSASGKM